MPMLFGRVSAALSPAQRIPTPALAAVIGLCLLLTDGGTDSALLPLAAAAVAFPMRPRDLSHTLSMRQLVDALFDHQGPLIDARFGVGGPVPAEQLARHAIAELAVQHALAARVLAGRWVSARDALANGATLDKVAAAMELTGDEVAVGLRSWADGQVRLHAETGLGLTGIEHDAVLALLDQPER